MKTRILRSYQISAQEHARLDRTFDRRYLIQKKQIQVGAKMGVPSILLIHNNLDPLQCFGTEQHDFIAAMYGEMTIVLEGGRVVNSFNGRNSLLREEQNTSFSAIGHLRATNKVPVVRLYENAFARNPLSKVSLPACFEIIHFEITH